MRFTILLVFFVFHQLYAASQSEQIQNKFAADFFTAFKKKDEPALKLLFADSLLTNEIIRLIRADKNSGSLGKQDDAEYHKDRRDARDSFLQNIKQKHEILTKLGMDWSTVKLDSTNFELKKRTESVNAFKVKMYFADYEIRIAVVLFDSTRSRFFCLDPRVKIMNTNIGFNVEEVENISAETVELAPAVEKIKQEKVAEPNSAAMMIPRSKTLSDNDIEAMPPTVIPPREKEEDVFEFVETLPQFPGGEQKMLEFIVKNLIYPPFAIENGIEGKVIVRFIVEKDGTINEMGVVRDIGAGCGQAALDVIKKMPQWSPGRQNGKAVRVKYHLPVVFKLK